MQATLHTLDSFSQTAMPNKMVRSLCSDRHCSEVIWTSCAVFKWSFEYVYCRLSMTALPNPEDYSLSSRTDWPRVTDRGRNCVITPPKTSLTPWRKNWSVPITQRIIDYAVLQLAVICGLLATLLTTVLLCWFHLVLLGNLSKISSWTAILC